MREWREDSIPAAYTPTQALRAGSAFLKCFESIHTLLLTQNGYFNLMPYPCWSMPWKTRDLITNPGVNVGIQNIDRNTDERHNHGKEHHQPLHNRIIALRDSLIQAIG